MKLYRRLTLIFPVVAMDRHTVLNFVSNHYRSLVSC